MKARPWAVALLAVLLGFATASCGVSSNDRARVVDPSDVPDQLRPTDTTTPPDGDGGPTAPVTAPVASDPVQLFFVRDDDLVPVTRRLPLPLVPGDALSALVLGPDPEARTDGLRSALGEGTPFVVAVAADGLAVVELGKAVAGLSGLEQRLAIGQVVFTLTGLPGVTEVRFEFDGLVVGVPRGDGTLTDDGEPVQRDDYAELLAPT